MLLHTSKREDIFRISSAEEFNDAALDIFQYQYANNSIYKQYADLIETDISSIKNYREIPFLPIELFKTKEIKSFETEPEVVFQSSGTTGMQRSRHYVADLALYEESFLKGFEYFYGVAKDYCFIALLPSYIERHDSSLVYMVNRLIETSRHSESSFYSNEYDKVAEVLKGLSEKGIKTILIGVSFALLDLADIFKGSLNENIIIMETGGMKGRRKEMLREELHSILCNAFKVDSIQSEYGMTELLSQAYSKGNGLFKCPPWMKVMIRDTNDPFSVLGNEKTGGVNIIDLANIYSCSFIATQDLGRLHDDESFEIVGRFDNSDIRGCNLLID